MVWGEPLGHRRRDGRGAMAKGEAHRSVSEPGLHLRGLVHKEDALALRCAVRRAKRWTVRRRPGAGSITYGL